MQRFSVQGVVRGGQVVLSPRLDLPDGITVTVTDGARDDAEWKLKVLTALKRLDLLDDPDWDATIKAERVANLALLMRELDRLEAERAQNAKSK